MSKSNPKNLIIGNMSAKQLLALFAEDDRHPMALTAELMRAQRDGLVQLAYGEYAEPPLLDVPCELAEAAYNELDRRHTALTRLVADNPGLRSLLGK